MAAGFEGGDVPALRVVEEDGAFFCAAEDGYDAPERGRIVQFWEEVEDEAGAGVQAEGGGEVEVFGGFWVGGGGVS